MKIFLATGNKHKIEEITAIFKNVKNLISHRANALKKLEAELETILKD